MSKQDEAAEPEEKGEEEAAAGTEPEEKGEEGGVRDSHGQPGINKERHDREMAEKDARIKELEDALEEASKTAEGREELASKIEELKGELAGERVDHSLEMAGCLNAKAAKAVLPDYDGDVAKLRDACPYLFSAGRKTGTTGARPEGAGRDEDSVIDRVLSKYKH